MAGLPPAAAVALGTGLADWQFRLSADDRKAVSANLSVLLDRPVGDRAVEVREVFRHFGRYLTEFIMVHRWGLGRFRVDGCEELSARLRPHRSVIVLSAHIGSWEVGGMAIRRLGRPVSVVALTHRDPAVDRLFNRQRQRAGVGVIPLNVHATRECLARLRTGGVVCLLGDRDFAGQGLRVTCHGHSLAVPRGPALLSLRTGVPMLPVFCIREGLRHLRFYTEPIITRPPARRDVDAAATAMMQQYANILDQYLQRYAQQWLMFQPRFGSDVRPDSPTVRDHPGV